MKKYQLTPEARKDLKEILKYIAADNPEAASRLIERIERKCQALAEMPESGRARDDLAPGLRSSVVGNYLILYRPVATRFQVIRVVHGYRDLPKLFG